LENWAGKVITLTHPTSSWTLEEKLSKHNTQHDTKTFYGYHKPGGAWAWFLYHNTRDPDNVAIIRIIM
jgi:hypothetical protein